MNGTHEIDKKRIRKRAIILTFFFLLWFLGLALRLAQLQILDHAALKAEVIERNQNIQPIVPERGTIFDRNGKILARSLPVPSIFFTPQKGESTKSQLAKIGLLKRALELTDKEFQKIEDRVENGSTFIYLKRKTNPKFWEKAERLNLNGVYFHEENKRSYPLGELAAHVLGGVNLDETGVSGVEFRYNAKLRGKEGKSLIWRDARKRNYQMEILEEAVPGKDLTLTIDETIQYIAEKELKKAVARFGAEGGTVIVSHPATGEILAMSSYPGYDPNDYSLASDQARLNRAIQQNFEPGSMFKIVPASAAIESGIVGPQETFDCSQQKFTIAGWTILDHKKMGILTFPEILIHSSNVGMCKVGQRLNQDMLYRTIKDFGFGDKTGIDLLGEEKGIFHPLSSWNKLFSLPSLSIGYEISVTAIQVLQAMNVIANQGLLAKPKIVKETQDPLSTANEEELPPKRVISEKTALELTRYLERAVSEGTGQQAQIPGYRIAGKTGTAQKLDPATRTYSSQKHVASFVGLVPVDKPLLSMIVVIDEPKGSLYYGGEVAAPVFREIGRRALLYLRCAPQLDPTAKIVTAQRRSED